MEFLDKIHDMVTYALHWVEGFAATPYGDWALFFISFAESSVFPIPPDILLIALCIGRPDLSFYFAMICSVASVLGGMAGYAIGYYGGRPLLRRLFDDRKIEIVQSYFDRWNAWATGIAGLTPIPYKIFTVSGGAFAINFKVFVIASIISRSLRFFGVATLIYFFGEPIKAFMEEYLDVLTIAFVVFLVLGYWIFTHSFARAGKQTTTEG